jgi:hypothetical protein
MSSNLITFLTRESERSGKEVSVLSLFLMTYKIPSTGTLV